MAYVSRTALFGKIHKILKKYYKPVATPAERTVLEHLLFACVLEDARYEPAEEAFAALRHTFYDWNEVRVTSISELSEVMAALPDPRTAANRTKRVLHSIFEELYCFDLEEQRKKNLGPAVKWLEKIDGTTRFVVAYVVQAALDGHSIPLDAGALAVFRVLDLVAEKETFTGEVPGMKRAVTKSKGVEFGSLLHQLGADYLANPFSPQVREIILAIDPEASQRFPQRRQPRPEAPAAADSDAQRGSAPPVAEVASPPPPAVPRKKRQKLETAVPSMPAAAEGKTVESAAAAGAAAETRPAEGKKAAGPASKKTAEAAAEPPGAGGETARPAQNANKSSRPGTFPPSATEKPHDRPPKAEKAEKAEKPSKAEKPERRSAEESRPSPADGLGKRKPR